MNPMRGLLAVVVLCGLVAGCGGGRDRGKNLDHDRPKATDRR